VRRQVLAVAAVATLVPAGAWASSLLPLTTETAETLPRGTVEAAVGVAYFDDMRFPFFTPPDTLRRQTLLGLPQLAVHVGAGNRVEIQARYELLYLDEETSAGATNSDYGTGDARIFTKVRLMHERGLWPALGVRFGVKLPNAGKDDRRGTDEADFGIDALASRTFGPLTAHVNLGILLLGNPGSLIGNSYDSGGQDDLVAYAVGVNSTPVLTRADTDLRLLGEVVGVTGSHYDNDRTSARVGLQVHHAALTVYAGVSAGLDTGAENVGASAGVTYAFELAHLFGE
jgi:hypothetical protein